MRGVKRLTDRSRRPVRYANQLPQQIESLIVRFKGEKPHWGARKIRELLVRRLAGDVRIPAKSTIHAVLDRHGLVKRIGRTRNRATGTPLSPGGAPNELWCADFKGEFKLGNGQYCYPLSALSARRDAMARAVGDVTNAPALFLDFYDRSRLATWVRAHAGLIPWVRQKAGRPLQGWRPYEGWALAPDGVEDVYLADDMARLHGENRDANGLPISDGIKRLRDSLREPYGVVRLAGLVNRRPTCGRRFTSCAMGLSPEGTRPGIPTLPGSLRRQ